MKPTRIIALLCSTVSGVALAQAPSPSDDGASQREEIVVVGTTPLPGSNIDINKVPGTVQLLTGDDFAKTHGSSILETLGKTIPGLQLSDSQGNSEFQDVHYRGFAASPLQGTPEGIAVYQNGIRLNEAFGDTVNWDLIPEVAIDRLTLTSNNPAFGLNALGGALNMVMKNGFTYQGLEAEIEGGSYGHVNGSIQYGAKWGDWGLYVAGEALTDDNYRQFSHSDLARIYADAGYQGDISEFHLTGTAARSDLGVVGSTPLDMIARYGISQIYNAPGNTQNEMINLAASGTVNLSDDIAIEGNVYGRHLEQKHVDGNDSDFNACPAVTAFPGQLCLDNDGFGNGNSRAFQNQFVLKDAGGQTFRFIDGAPYGTDDRTSTNITTVGAALQMTVDAPVMDHANNLAIGVSLDHSDIHFTSNSTLGVLDPDLDFGLDANLPGSGAIIHTQGAVGYQPVALDATTDYYGIYATDTFDITSALSATVGFRVNIIDIGTRDDTGSAAELNADNDYTHVSPQAGLTYKLGGGVTAYAGYSQSNRAPTPLELDCANRLKPCLLENSLVSDPSLKQVIADNYEAGFRGAESDVNWGRVVWSAGYYRVQSNDDIISLASTIHGRGYYQNVPETLRQGAEVSANWRWRALTVYANYSYIDATYQFTGVLSSANNPSANAVGNIKVHPGDALPGIPAHQVKFGLDYDITPDWTVGGDTEYYGSQYLVGDDANQNARLTPYMLVNLRSSYQVTENIQIFGKINNLFDRRYASFGTYGDTDGVGQPLTENLIDPRSLTIGQPISFFGGVKFKL